MIFVTVGTQLPFDRLIDAVALWCKDHPETEVFAQVGPGRVEGRPFRCEPFVSPSEVDKLMQGASVVVSHAGMGSILTALRYRRPIIIMPRKADLAEHRNDHQLATARWMSSRPGVSVAWDAGELRALLDRRGELVAGPELADTAEGTLVARVRDYIRAVAKVR